MAGRILESFLLISLGLSLLQAADDWPRWRGPSDTGVARGDAPVEWNDTRNIAWKANIPGRGHSSPVLWGDLLFLTTAVPAEQAAPAPVPAPEGGQRRGPGGGAASGVEHKLLVLALDRHSGKTVWQHSPKTVKPHEGYHQRYGSFASNSPVTDGKRLYASFGSLGLFAYDLKGKLLWQKEFPPMSMRNAFGEGVAPVIDEESIYLKFDHEGSSYFLVLDKATGAERWRAPREEQSSWSPALIHTVNGKKQVIVSATGKTRAYDAAAGKVIWECAGLGANVIPAPVVSKDLVIVQSGFRNPNMQAIRLGKEGDLAGTDAIVWTNERANSYTPSPVLHEDKLYFVTDNGFISCVNAQTGEAYYRQQRLPKPTSLKASPVAANGKLYISTEDGDVVVVRMGEKYEVLAVNTLADQMFVSSPAVAGGSIYLRGQGTLFCVREGNKTASR
jgi:outer membrane protein assembly factor BamB